MLSQQSRRASYREALLTWELCGRWGAGIEGPGGLVKISRSANQWFNHSGCEASVCVSEREDEGCCNNGQGLAGDALIIVWEKQYRRRTGGRGRKGRRRIKVTLLGHTLVEGRCAGLAKNRSSCRYPYFLRPPQLFPQKSQTEISVNTHSSSDSKNVKLQRQQSARLCLYNWEIPLWAWTQSEVFFFCFFFSGGGWGGCYCGLTCQQLSLIMRGTHGAVKQPLPSSGLHVVNLAHWGPTGSPSNTAVCA